MLNKYEKIETFVIRRQSHIFWVIIGSLKDAENQLYKIQKFSTINGKWFINKVDNNFSFSILKPYNSYVICRNGSLQYLFFGNRFEAELQTLEFQKILYENNYSYLCSFDEWKKNENWAVINTKFYINPWKEFKGLVVEYLSNRVINPSAHIRFSNDSESSLYPDETTLFIND